MQQTVISFFIFVSALLVIGFEYKVNLLPQHYFEEVSNNMKVIFTVYGRVNFHLFVGMLINFSSLSR
jgi:hypothetical protein